MAEIKNFPNNVDEYIGAQNVMKWLHGRTSGVFGADGNLSVTANGNMTVRVSDGVGWLANDKADGTVFWNDTKEQTGSELQLTIPMANSVSPRIDRVVVSWDTVDYAAKPRIEVLKGMAASTPVAPALTNNSLLRQISLARVYVGAAVSKITADNITDERLDSSVCGLVTDWIRVDTTAMQESFEAFLSRIETELNQLNAGTASMMRATYDPQGRNTDIFKYTDKVANVYYATLNVTRWSSTGAADQAKGLLYQQTATLSCANSHAPAVTESSVFLSGVGFNATGVAGTDDALGEVLEIINKGRTETISGAVLVKVREKPAASISARWTIQA